jgi:hypothetical protein
LEGNDTDIPTIGNERKSRKFNHRSLRLGEVNIYGENGLNGLRLTGNYLYGITGDVIFKNKILIINRKNNTFGIIE